MADETIISAARRLVRFIRINDESDGGLLSRDTMQAADTLDREWRKLEPRFECLLAAERELTELKAEIARFRDETKQQIEQVVP